MTGSGVLRSDHMRLESIVADKPIMKIILIMLSFSQVTALCVSASSICSE